MDDKAKTMDIAVQGLLDALDKTPRIHWAQSIMMALQAAKELGYAEGYRVGSFELEKKQAAAEKEQEGLAGAAGYVANSDHAVPITVGVEGEDKTLSSHVPTPEEVIEDIGFSFVKEIARQFGHLSIQQNITPKSVELTPELINENGRVAWAVHLFLKP